MTLAITRQVLTTTMSRPLSQEESQRVRSHPNRLASGHDDAIAARKGRESMNPVSMTQPRAELPVGRFPAAFKAGQVAKVAGYNSSGPYATTTGTSREGVLCATDGMSVCAAVVLAADAVSPGDKAKVRVFHVFPDNFQAPQQVADAISKLRGEGLMVSAAMRGGTKEIMASEVMVDALKDALDQQGVPLLDLALADDPHSFDPAPLGGVIRSNFAIVTDDVRVFE